MGLDIVELMMGVEQRFRLSIPDEDASTLETPRKLVDYVAGRLEDDARPHERIEEEVFEVIRETTGLTAFDPDAHFVRDLHLD